MPRKSAAAVKEQPDLLGGHQPQPGPKPKAPTTGSGVSTKPKAETVAKPAVNKGNLTVVKNNPTNTLALIGDALKDPNFKPENMRLVLDMHKEMVTEQARIDFINAFHLLKRELPRINKDGKIEILEKGQDGKRVAGRDKVQQATPYATYDNIREAVDPILDRHGFTMWDETEPSPDGTRLHVITHLDHNSGHGRRSVFPVPAEVSGSKNNVQGWGSSNSYGKRYGALNLLNLRTKAPEDRDLDGNKPKVTKAGKPITSGGEVLIEGEVVEDTALRITNDQADKLIEAIEACGATRKQFCASWQIERVNDLLAEHFDRAMKACRDRAAKQK